jgi:GNAT superfamily N-acetyltransferase
VDLTESGPTAAWRIRVATPEDGQFLRAMLYECAFWHPSQPRPPLDEALAEPHLARYIEGWPRAGDAGVIAEDQPGQPIGAAWYRFFSPDAPGYGYLDAATPELSIAVAPGHRGRGVGAGLLAALLTTARQAAVPTLSLSVAQANPAVALYERHGFREVRLDGDSWTMRVDLNRSEGEGGATARLA